MKFLDAVPSAKRNRAGERNVGKKEKKRGDERGKSAALDAPRSPIISRRGWKVIGIGVGVAALGYVVLSFTDARGQNIASTLSPLLILSGYAVIGAGIILRDPPSA